MVTSNTPRVTTALSVAAGIFLISALLPKILLTGSLPKLATTQGLELILALMAIAFLGKSRFSEYGFCKPQVSQTPSE